LSLVELDRISEPSPYRVFNQLELEIFFKKKKILD